MDKNLQKIFDKLLNKNVEMLATDEITGKSADDVIAILEEYDEYIDSMEQPNDDYQRKWNRWVKKKYANAEQLLKKAGLVSVENVMKEN